MIRPLENLDDIRGVAQTVLRKADIAERLPTPVNDIIASCGLLESDDYVLSESKIAQAPRELRKILRAAGRKIRGALDRRERVLHVSPSVDHPAQRQFVRCHEAMHDALPWQRDLLVLGDTKRTLAPDIEFTFEREANQGGAELLFQLDLLTRVARDYPIDISTPVQLSALFGASIHATFRRWVESSASPVCGLAIDPKPLIDTPPTYRRYELVESESWTRRYGPNRFPARMDSSRHGFLAPLGLPGSTDINLSWGLHDCNAEMTTVKVQSFSNTYRVFVLLWLPSKESFIARHRARPRLVVG
ncbi:M78 family metallopeptidase domain-containing protein [Mycobacterium sp. MUNTM1]